MQNFEKKNRPKKALVGTFWKILTENRVFSARAPPIPPQGRSAKILGSIGKNGFLKKYQWGAPLGRQGVKSLRGLNSPLPIMPVN